MMTNSVADIIFLTTKTRRGGFEILMDMVAKFEPTTFGL